MTDIFRCDWIEAERHTDAQAEVCRYLVDIKQRHVTPEESKRAPIPGDMLPKAGTQAAILLNFVRTQLGGSPTISGDGFDDLYGRAQYPSVHNPSRLYERYAGNGMLDVASVCYRMPQYSSEGPYLETIYFGAGGSGLFGGHKTSICFNFHADGKCYSANGCWDTEVIADWLQRVQGGNLDIKTMIEADLVARGYRKAPEPLAA